MKLLGNGNLKGIGILEAIENKKNFYILFRCDRQIKLD